MKAGFVGVGLIALALEGCASCSACLSGAFLEIEMSRTIALESAVVEVCRNDACATAMLPEDGSDAGLDFVGTVATEHGYVRITDDVAHIAVRLPGGFELREGDRYSTTVIASDGTELASRRWITKMHIRGEECDDRLCIQAVLSPQL